MPPDKPAPGTSPGQRTLAAIVFTDVVSFSARMHSDEVGTLRLLQRDFAEMRRLCADFEGQVLKTTGDGLLLTFTSAVQAVAGGRGGNPPPAPPRPGRASACCSRSRAPSRRGRARWRCSASSPRRRGGSLRKGGLCSIASAYTSAM